MMRMSVSVISVYRIGYRYRLILLLNIGYRNNRLIWISVQHYLQLYLWPKIFACWLRGLRRKTVLQYAGNSCIISSTAIIRSILLMHQY